ncbi:cysteine desulfurase NifS [Chloroflexota bacterium]
MKRIYLDYAATTPTHPEVVQAMLPYFTEFYGNPSGIHALAQQARVAIEEVRSRLASFLNARADEIIFTSGGTESDNTAIKGVALANEDRGNHIITSAVEHHAVLKTCEFLEQRGFSVTYLPVDENGTVAPGDVKEAITDKTILISIMHANNEIGTIQPVAEIGGIAREAGVYFHTDAVQTTGHIPIDVEKLKVDLLSISAHKLYGPKGIGALYARQGTRMASLLHGGGHEGERRAGTENVPGVIGFGKAIEIAGREMGEEVIRLTALRERLISELMSRIDHIRLNGHPTNRLPNNVNMSISFIDGEAIGLNLDHGGICASTGSACSSGSMEASFVLTATGVPPETARGSVRFTLGKWTSEGDIDRVVALLPGIVNKLRAISPLLKN